MTGKRRAPRPSHHRHVGRGAVTEIHEHVGTAALGRPAVPDQRIVQAWRVVDWNPGVYSIVKFELNQQGSGTKLVFDHTGFPVGLAKHLADGWKEHYWEPLQKYLT